MTANRERFAETFLPELPADEVGLLEEEPEEETPGGVNVEESVKE